MQLYWCFAFPCQSRRLLIVYTSVSPAVFKDSVVPECDKLPAYIFDLTISRKHCLLYETGFLCRSRVLDVMLSSLPDLMTNMMWVALMALCVFVCVRSLWVIADVYVCVVHEDCMGSPPWWLAQQRQWHSTSLGRRRDDGRAEFTRAPYPVF